VLTSLAYGFGHRAQPVRRHHRYPLPARPNRRPAADTAYRAKRAGTTPYLTIKGLRDSQLRLLGLALLAFAGARATAWFMLVVALLPLATR